MNKGPSTNYLAIGASARGRNMVEHGLLAIQAVWVNQENDPWVVQEVLIRVKPTRAQVKDHVPELREAMLELEKPGDDLHDKIEQAINKLDTLVKNLPFQKTTLLLFGQDAWSAARYYYDFSRVRPTLVQRPWNHVEYVHENVPFILNSEHVVNYLKK